MSTLRQELEAELTKKLNEIDQLLPEMRAVRSAVLKDNPKKNKWLTTLTDRTSDLDRYIRQNKNKVQAQSKRKEYAEKAINRKRHNRQKYLLGALVEHLIKNERIDQNFIESELESFLVSEDDKNLFADYFETKS
uniref:hypothetical protein n=1 Tax=Psychrobacter sp. TaxID=56811 RepID=UPI0015EEAC89|nr:hypothetical protein [Psychrobacter sp.]